MIQRARWIGSSYWTEVSLGVFLVIPGLRSHVGTCFLTYVSDAGRLTLHTPSPATLTVPPLQSLFSLPVSSTSSHPLSRTILAVTDNFIILVIHAHLLPDPSLSIQLETSLPLPSPPTLISPVDPMAWSGTSGETSALSADAHDTLLSVSDDGELAFWVPENGLLELLEGDARTNGAHVNGDAQTLNNGWRCTGRVRTGRRGLSRAACSSAKKSVLGMLNLIVVEMLD